MPVDCRLSDFDARRWNCGESRPRGRFARGWIRNLGLLAVWAAILSPLSNDARAEVTATQVQTAIDRGIRYLRSTQLGAGNWPEYAGQSCGLTSLCTLALLNAGVSSDDPAIRKAMTYLRRKEPNETYSVALQTLVYCQLGSAADVTRIRRNVQWLVDRQVVDGPRIGGWGYGEQKGGADPSNSQFAILALGAAEDRGVEVDSRVFQRAQQYWIDRQKSNGGWVYAGLTPKGSMTCAGVASLVICRGHLGDEEARLDGDQIACCGESGDPSDEIEHGLKWLGDHFAVSVHPGAGGSSSVYYYLYALERVGRKTGRRLIGGHDWYREGAEFLVGEHEKFMGTYWKGSGFGEKDPNVTTSFALLFLAKGKRQVVAGRLRYGDDAADASSGGQWQRHQDGVRQLVRRVARDWGRDLTWQTIDLQGARTEDLLQAPVLIISGSEALPFSADQKDLLKSYVDQGGCLLFEANAGNGCGPAEAFERSVQQLCSEWFSTSSLEKLPPSHPIWTAEGRVDPAKLGPDFWMYGVQACCRTAVFYTPQSLNCRWEWNDRVQRGLVKSSAVRGETNAATQLGQNLIAYATGRDLQDKLDVRSMIEPETAEKPDRGFIKIPKLAVDAGSEEANRALPNLVAMVQKQVPLRVGTVSDPVALDADALEPYSLVWLHGRTDFTLTSSQRSALRTYLENEGVLLVDAICGSPEFTNAVRRELAAVLPNSPLQTMPPDHPALTSQFGGYDLSSVTLRKPSKGAAGVTINRRRTTPPIEMASLGGIAVVFLSPYDLSCALESPNSIQCPGYDTEDAVKIGTNLILYSLQQ
ncbi:MAG: DUF4159 domain-containing protein [Pirellulaceae bacterium]